MYKRTLYFGSIVVHGFLGPSWFPITVPHATLVLWTVCGICSLFLPPFCERLEGHARCFRDASSYFDRIFSHVGRIRSLYDHTGHTDLHHLCKFFTRWFWSTGAEWTCTRFHVMRDLHDRRNLCIFPLCVPTHRSVRSVGQADQDLSLIHISEPTRLLSISYAVFCLKKKQ